MVAQEEPSGERHCLRTLAPRGSEVGLRGARYRTGFGHRDCGPRSGLRAPRCRRHEVQPWVEVRPSAAAQRAIEEASHDLASMRSSVVRG